MAPSLARTSLADISDKPFTCPPALSGVHSKSSEDNLKLGGNRSQHASCQQQINGHNHKPSGTHLQLQWTRLLVMCLSTT
mmetsp:Transcript_32126/g.50141  ORF Transcript_32126/g.50141 Transcript_32126/m.50141 type:complete len:80 (-) Transcript_32126:173-412(-)